MRVKGGPKRKNRRKKILQFTEGMTGRPRNAHKLALRAMERSLAYAQRDRKATKRNMRRLWIVRITAAVRARGFSYSKFMGALKDKNIELNRKVLAQLAATDPKSFDNLLQSAGLSA
jgi:large subunit ribosomal protein L20